MAQLLGWAFRPKWEGLWFRACPKDPIRESATMPTLRRSARLGTLKAETRPDGMYVQLARDEQTDFLTADVLAIEHCGVLQNVKDKRSRYQASTGSLLLKLPTEWLMEKSE